jgi:hypothetical protein
MISPVSGDQLQRSADQSFGVAQPLLGFADRGPEVFPTGRNPQWANLGKLLSISLYVFGDDRQGRCNGVVHGVSLACGAGKSRLPR